MLTSCGVHTADPMKSGNGKHDKRARVWLDAVCRHKIDLLPGTASTSLIDDQFPTPIRLPLLMNVRDDSNSSLQRSTALCEPTLICVVMSQETVAGGIGIVVESHMTPDDIWKRLDVVPNAWELEPRE